MNLLIAIFTLSLSFTAFARAIKLTEYQAERNVSVYRMDFDVNKSLNRAWVTITLADDSFGDTYYTDNKIKVPGLAYDTTINGIVFQNDGETIVCGTFYNQRWTIDLGMSFSPTGRCKIVSTIKSKEVDDGYDVRKVDMIEVQLIVE